MGSSGKSISIPQKLAVFHDLSGFGRCSLSVILPVVSALGVQVCPVPTAILSNHTAFPREYRCDFTPHMAPYLKAWEDLELSFDGILTGYMNQAEQVRAAAEFIDRNRRTGTLVFVDPAMADHGKLYRGFSEEYAAFLRDELVCRADIIKPNLTEGCLLAGLDYEEFHRAASEHTMRHLKAMLINLTQDLFRLGPKKIVITGIEHGSRIINAVAENGTVSFLSSPRTGENRPGTGDLFSSIVCASLMKGMTLGKAVSKATDFISTAIAVSEAAGVPVREGVIFESILSKLSATADSLPETEARGKTGTR